MFENYQNEVNTTSSTAVYTGPAVVKVLAINPTEFQLKDIIGDRASAFSPDYSIRRDRNDNDVRPVTFWLQDVEDKNQPVPFTIYLSDKNVEYSTGSFEWVNDKLQDVKAQNIEDVVNNPRMSWFDSRSARKAKVGEVDFYKFLTNCMRFNNSSGKAVQALTDEKCDFETVYNGDFSGLHKLADYLNKNGFGQIMLYGAKITQKDDRVYVNPKIVNNPETWFRGDNIDSSLSEKLKEKYNRRPFTNLLFTLDFEVFNEEKAFNYEPEPSETAKKEVPSWLNH